jgi:hypothetical protein
MHHFIIWAIARTGSTTLGRALGALNEPLQRLGENFADVAEIESLCATRQSVKHLYEECPDANNIALARAATRHGYRHIHLVRCNEFARLVSRDIATQKEAWTPELAASRFAALKAGDDNLQPLNVNHLLNLHWMAVHRWRAIREQVGTLLTVRFEDLTAVDRPRRHKTLRRLGAYLGLSHEELGKLERAMINGGQRTHAVWNLAPNIGELRRALIGAGAV